MFWENYCQSFKGGKAIVDPTVYRIAKVDPMHFERTKVNPLEVRELLSILPTVYRRAKVDPMHFGRTKVDPLEVGKLLLILQCIGELRSNLCILGELRSIP